MARGGIALARNVERELDRDSLAAGHLGHMLSRSARATDSAFPPELQARISPLGWAHILLTGGYR